MSVEELYQDLLKKAKAGPAHEFTAAYEAWTEARTDEGKKQRATAIEIYQARQRAEAEAKGKARQAERDRIEEEARQREAADKQKG